MINKELKYDYWNCINNDQLEDLDKVVNFLNQEYFNGLENPIWSEEYFKWKLGNKNPAGKGYMSIAMMNDQVVGIATMTLKRALFHGKHVIIGEMGDCYTSLLAMRYGKPSQFIHSLKENHYINKSIFGRLANDIRERAEKDGIFIIYGTPNAKAYPGWINRLNYFEYQHLNNYNYIKPTVNYVIQQFPLLKRYGKLIIKVESIFTSLIQLFCLNNRKTTIVSGKPSEEEINNINIYQKKDLQIIKDYKFFNYRFFNHPFAKYDYFKIYRSNKIIGLIITRLIKTESNSPNLGIVQYIGDPDVIFSTRTINTLVKSYEAIQIQKIYLYANANSKISNKLRKILFFKASKVPIIFANNPENSITSDIVFEELSFQIGDTDAI